MEIKDWQFYWPNWWKLWPTWHKEKQEFAGIMCAGFVFCFGPIQIRGWL